MGMMMIPKVIRIVTNLDQVTTDDTRNNSLIRRFFMSLFPYNTCMKKKKKLIFLFSSV